LQVKGAIVMLRTKLILGAVTVLLLVRPEQVHTQNKTSISFNIQPGSNRSVIIQWTVNQETGALEYFVEKSTDKKTWEVISTPVYQVSHDYSYTDLCPLEGLNYYRVTSIRGKDRIVLTDVKWIQVSNADKLYIWPTPTNDILHVRSPFFSGYMDIIDSDGRFVKRITMIDFITNVPVQALPGGMYFIRVRHGKDVLVEKFIKQQGY